MNRYRISKMDPGKLILGSILYIMLLPAYSQISESSINGQIRVVIEGNKATVLFSLPEVIVGKIPEHDYPEVFMLYTLEGYKEDHPSMLGKYQREGDRVEFNPRFALISGLKYVAVINWSKLTEIAGDLPDSQDAPLKFMIPEEPVEVTKVTMIYPNATIVPSNLLRFYVYFDRPMNYENPYQYIRLLDENGARITESFVEFREGLWDNARQRLTLIIHPGRIKRNVGPNSTLGPVLEENRSYTLNISGDWKDSRGKPLGRDYVHEFQTTEADRTRIDPESWSVQYDKNDGITITFDGSLDIVLAQRMFTILDPAGTTVRGSYYATTDRSLLFVPDSILGKGVYTLAIDSRLEDLAGNTIHYVFDSEKSTMANVNPDKTEIRFSVETP